MLKKIVNLQGSKMLNKEEQKDLNGGFGVCPQVGNSCVPNSPVNCITILPIVCCNGVFTLAWKCFS